MADYVSGNSRSKTPVFLGIAAVAIVVILGLVAFGGGGEPGMAPAPDGMVVAPDAAPAADPEAAPVFE